MSSFKPVFHQFTALEPGSPANEDLSAELAAIRDWDRFLRDAENHGLSGIILEYVVEHSVTVPDSALLSLKALKIRHRSMADARAEALAELSEGFRAANCPWLALKGLALAPLIYPDDGLRPMRDMDILLPRASEALAANTLRELGYTLPEKHDDKYNRDSHQLPNAWKHINGFKISIEIHHDAIERDAPGHLYYEEVTRRQTVQWRDCVFEAPGHELMLDQLCRHLAGRHPGSWLKLINVKDIVLYSEKFIDEINWAGLSERHPHVINTLKCLHLITPLSVALQGKVGGVAEVDLDGVGETISILKDVVESDVSLADKISAMMLPPEWWMHLYYGIPPGQSLWSVKLFRHPAALTGFFGRRIWSRLLGG